MTTSCSTTIGFHFLVSRIADGFWDCERVVASLWLISKVDSNIGNQHYMATLSVSGVAMDCTRIAVEL